jgi:hypothetical protein
MDDSTRNGMIATLRDMGEHVDSQNDNELVGEYMLAHGIEADFIANNTLILQTLNENKTILAKVSALCFP